MQNFMGRDKKQTNNCQHAQSFCFGKNVNTILIRYLLVSKCFENIENKANNEIENNIKE